MDRNVLDISRSVGNYTMGSEMKLHISKRMAMNLVKYERMKDESERVKILVINPSSSGSLSLSGLTGIYMFMRSCCSHSLWFRIVSSSSY